MSAGASDKDAMVQVLKTIGSDAEEYEASPTSSLELGAVVLRPPLCFELNESVVMQSEPDGMSGVVAVDCVHSMTNVELDSVDVATCDTRVDLNAAGSCLDPHFQGCESLAGIEPICFLEQSSWIEHDDCTAVCRLAFEESADANEQNACELGGSGWAGTLVLQHDSACEPGVRVWDDRVAPQSPSVGDGMVDSSRELVLYSSVLSGGEMDLKRGRRGCVRRGKGARARGRVALKLRRRSLGICGATGFLADACSTSHGATKLTKESSYVVSLSADGSVVVESVRAAAMSVVRKQWELTLALRLQHVWRRRCARVELEIDLGKGGVASGFCLPCVSIVPSRIEAGWTGKHAKKHGSLRSHVLFMQWIFRAVCTLAPGTWGRSTVPSFVWLVIRLCRRTRLTKCGMGKRLASGEEFAQQKKLADEMLDWYGQYVAIFRKLSSNESPRIFDDFCGGGAVAEGVRRGGGVPFGLDIEEQPSYRCRFGRESFTCADGVDWSVVRRLQKKHRLRLAGASPPCKFYSTARQKGESKQPPLIAMTRDMLQALFDWWWLENVMGAQNYMSEDATEVDGPYFGLRVFRSRLFETNFGLHVDELVRGPADRLRERCCLGHRNRWRTFDEFGRPFLVPCCAGNVYVPIGETAWRCTSEECAWAMDVDPGHMPYDRLAQAVPPAYSQWVFSQMCMRIVHAEFGCPIFTFDEMKSNPALAKRVVAQWLCGVGADSPSAGMTLVPRVQREAADEVENDDWQAETSYAFVAETVSLALADGGDATSGGGDHEAGRDFIPEIHSNPLPEKEGVRHDPVGVAGELYSLGTPRIEEGVFRELYYAHFGGFEQQWSSLGTLPWLPVLRSCTTLRSEELPSVGELIGKNTYVEVDSLQLAAVASRLAAAVSQGGRGTRVLLVTPASDISSLIEIGFKRVDCIATYGGEDALRAQGLTAVWCGARASPRCESKLDHDAVRHEMDPRDRDDYVEDKVAKAELTWSPISHDPALWRGKGMPADVEAIMTEGVRIDVDADAASFEVPQYPYPDEESLMESLFEADRALSVGHMEYVPDEMVETILREHIVHPWLMVWQGKWRLCQDYSDGTNLTARSGPFGLPSAWDAMSVLKPGSYLSKYDLRDFFWSIPVHPDSRKHLVMRHPGTGRLMWCRALPFGYLDSPRQSCRVSEALAGEMRRRAAGKGIHFFCYVDDYLVIGDTYELSLEGNKIFEEVMKEFGMQWAPAKHRGPVKYLEFLGLLLCNVEGHRCIALTEKRQMKLRTMIDEWLLEEPDGEEVTKVKPVDLAKLLGHLVFASQVVPGGRTYMQNMLSSFKGLEVDWKHGRVRPRRGEWQLISLAAEFWIDLNWWSDHLNSRNCKMIIAEHQLCDAMITGTDASDWGVGTVVWLDGHKEECNMEFTFAERRRPINFRELLGIVRIVELYGHRMRGCKVLIETDNMAARGAAENLSSTASSMQEMIRRLYEWAECYGITVVPIHTPGAKLFRPDQTSRGDPIEEPRLRLKHEIFSLFEHRFGPFTEFVGAERRHDTGSNMMSVASGGAPSKLWLHPAHNTVGSALRLLGDRMSGYDGDEASYMGPPLSGVVIVPFAPEANWWKLIRHFTCIGRWEIGDEHLEMNQLGKWRAVRAKRASLALAFPRSAGHSIKPIELELGMNKNGYVSAPDAPARGLMLPLPAGAFVYNRGPRKGVRGELLVVWDEFRPYEAGRENDEEGNLRVSCAQLLLVPKKGETSCEYEFVRANHANNGSFSGMSKKGGNRDVPWEMASDILWSVDHLVKVDASVEMVAVAGASPKIKVADMTKRKFLFNFQQAEKEIERWESWAAPFTPVVDKGPYNFDEMVAAFEDLTPADGGVSGEGDHGLTAARKSADEAAAMKKTLIRTPAVRRTTKEVESVNNRARSVCRYTAQRCEGCDGVFNLNEAITAGFRAMIHPTGDCLRLAQEKMIMRENTKAASSKATAGKATTVRKAKLIAMNDGERLVRARNCLDGCCQVLDEERVMCLRGCGRGIHLTACLNTSGYYSAAGRLICVHCRLSEIMESGDSEDAPATLVQQVTLAMVAELTSGAVSTAAGRNRFVSLERRWAAEMLNGRIRIRVKLPRHNMESFCAFLWWLITDADLARSFATTIRTAGAVMSMLELEDWTKTARVKAVIKEIEKLTGVESEPCTHTTRRIVRIMIEQTIKSECSKGKDVAFNRVLNCRTMLLLVLELMGGLRVGEATSSGDLHGLEANNVRILRPVASAVDDGLGETVEAKIIDSKTGPGRYVAFVASSCGPGEIKAGAAVKSWINISGMKWNRTGDGKLPIEGGFEVRSPNYWVVRVFLSSYSQEKFDRFLMEVDRSRCEQIVSQASAIKVKARERYNSKNMSHEMRYVNMTGGHRVGENEWSEDIKAVCNWLEKIDFNCYAFIVPGPLIRATVGKTLSHMPLATGSTYTHLGGAMKAAYEISSKMKEPDEELDLQGKAPKFSNHSLRRHADKLARDSLHRHEADGVLGVTKQLIDFFFGWLIKEMVKDMQLHYAGLDTPSRRILARVTMFF